jgi:hypothetical protein
MLGLVLILLWLIAIFLPTIVIVGIAAYTGDLGMWEVWLNAALFQGLWWYLSDAYN